MLFIAPSARSRSPRSRLPYAAPDHANARSSESERRRKSRERNYEKLNRAPAYANPSHFIYFCETKRDRIEKRVVNNSKPNSEKGKKKRRASKRLSKVSRRAIRRHFARAGNDIKNIPLFNFTILESAGGRRATALLIKSINFERGSGDLVARDADGSDVSEPLFRSGEGFRNCDTIDIRIVLKPRFSIHIVHLCRQFLMRPDVASVVSTNQQPFLRSRDFYFRLCKEELGDLLARTTRFASPPF